MVNQMTSKKRAGLKCHHLTKFLLVFVLLLSLTTIVSAEDFGYNYLKGDLDVAQAVNYSQQNVNNSQFWDGNAWSDVRWLDIDGSNANQNINVSPYNITADSFIGDGSLLTGISSLWNDSGTTLTPHNAGDSINTAGYYLGDGDTGFYEFIDDNLRLKIGGTNTYSFDSNGLSSALYQGFYLRNLLSSDVIPNICPDNSDLNTGIGSAGADELSMIAGGSEGVRVTTTGINLKHDTDIDGTLSVEGNTDIYGLAKIHASGVASGDGARITLFETSSNVGKIYNYNDDTSSFGDFEIGGTSTAGTGFYYDHSTNSWGLGVANSPYGKLQISADTDSEAGGIAIESVNNARTLRLWAGNDLVSHVDSGGAGGNGVLAFNSGGTGKVGIGTDSPDVSLEILKENSPTTFGGITNPSLKITNTYSTSFGSYSELQFGGFSGVVIAGIGAKYTKWNAYGNVGGGLHFFTKNPYVETAVSEKMTLLYDGKVGIGTTTPSAKLDVNGDAIIRGDFNTTGNFIGNQIYGEMWYYNHTATSLTFVTDGLYYNLTFSDSTLNGMTFNDAGDYLEVDYSGHYKACFMASGSGQNNHEYYTSVSINGVIQDKCESHKKMSAGGDIVTQNGCCLITLSINDKVRLATADVGNTGNGNYYSSNLNLVRIGD